MKIRNFLVLVGTLTVCLSGCQSACESVSQDLLPRVRLTQDTIHRARALMAGGGLHNRRELVAEWRKLLSDAGFYERYKNRISKFAVAAFSEPIAPLFAGEIRCDERGYYDYPKWVADEGGCAVYSVRGSCRLYCVRTVSARNAVAYNRALDFHNTFWDANDTLTIMRTLAGLAQSGDPDFQYYFGRQLVRAEKSFNEIAVEAEKARESVCSGSGL